jgi:hypothetical protein
MVDGHFFEVTNFSGDSFVLLTELLAGLAPRSIKSAIEGEVGLSKARCLLVHQFVDT